MRKLANLVAILPFLIAIHSAHAASRESKERAARKACLTGDAIKGVEILVDLFIETGDLTYIYNQGRCFEQNRRYEDAIGHFREYLVKGKKLSAEERSDAEKHIAICQSYLGKVETTQPVPAPATQPVPATRSEVEPQVAMQPAVSTIAPKPQVAPGSSGSALRISGVVAASVGGAALITGVILNIKVNSIASDLEQPLNYTRSTDSTRKDYKTLGWVSYGVGAACVATGAVLYYLGWQKGRSSHVEVAVIPTFASGTAGAVLTGAF